MVFRLNSCVTKASIVALVLGLVACGGTTTTTTTTTTETPAAGSTTTTAPSGTEPTGGVATQLVLNSRTNLIGAGASFPAPLYQRWFQDFSGAVPNLQVDYQSVGSGAGIERFTQSLVNFGASDVAMTDEEIARVTNGVILLPMTAGAIVLSYNVPDVPELKLSREVYSEIFLGKITNWNDPKIAADNAGVTLPDLPITPIFRSDGSGTTGVFTKHLSAISEDWKSSVGDGKTVQWPVGIGAPKNDGVAAQIGQTPGSIGYIEEGFAKNAGLAMASLQNKAGKFVMPSPENTSAALAAVELPENLRAFIDDPEGEASYPIVTYSWMLANTKYSDPAIAKALEATIEYGLTQGQKVSAELGYIPLPENVVEKVAAAADAISPDYQIKVK
ncbi:MAG: phosphate ABC transporter substrate-binding protein PstS [Microcoleaceae cyanobacterium]